MTGEQYVRANKRVYNVVIILLAVMTILSVMACLAEFKITILLQTAAAVAGIIVVNTYAKKFWNSKKGGEILLGTGSAVYCVFLLLNQNKSSCLKKPVFMRVSAISISLLITN
ncbi:hypothetical protein [Roseburia intestinalis]